LEKDVSLAHLQWLSAVRLGAPLGRHRDLCV
jgi:hypothetical protein